jgi:hypothetical protein
MSSKLFEQILSESWSATASLTPTHALKVAKKLFQKGKSNWDVKNFLQKYVDNATFCEHWSPLDTKMMIKIQSILKRMGHTKIDAAPLEDWLTA